MIYGYARCSTTDTKQDINRQKRELKKLGVVDEERLIWEYESTSKTRNKLNKLLEDIEEGATIATTEVSRLSRSTRELCDIIAIVEKKQLKLIIGDSMTVDCTRGELDPMTNAFVQIAGVFAELEKKMLSQRVKSGMANAIAKGAVVGRPITTIDSLPANFLRHYPKYQAKQINVTEFARLCDLSRQSIYKYIKIYKGSVE